MSYIGVNIGALTVKVVAVRADATTAKVMAHQGRPLEVLQELLATAEFANGEYFGVTGHLGHIPNMSPGPLASLQSVLDMLHQNTRRN